MTRELLLARRLLEAVADPDASTVEAEQAGVEMAELLARLGVEPGRLFAIETFEGLQAQDFSPSAWLYLLETLPKDQPEIPEEILDRLYLDYSDPALRFRLVRGALTQPRTRRAYEDALRRTPYPAGEGRLPPSWPRLRIRKIAADAVAVDSSLDETGSRTTAEDAARAAEQALQEFVLYLLQDGSTAALGLAAAAVAADAAAAAPAPWRNAARDLARNVVTRARQVDPDYGAAFGRLL